MLVIICLKMQEEIIFLFLDADFRIENNLIGDSISFMENEKLSFLSIFSF